MELPFESARFDFVVAFMSLMDISETVRVLAEVFWVLRPRGVLVLEQFGEPCPSNEAVQERPGLQDAQILRTSCT